MPHWIALFAIVLVGWLLLSVIGGLLLGRGLGVVERRSARRHGGEPDVTDPDDLPRAA